MASEMDIPEILDMMAEFYAIDDYPFDRHLNERNLYKFLADEKLGKLWLIIQDSNIVGYVVLAFGFSFEYGGRDAFIDELFIKNQYRGKGIGTEVLKMLEKEAADLGVQAIHLEVEKHNEKGNRLYTKSGYSGQERWLLTKNIRS